jgi:hypothetical protein
LQKEGDPPSPARRPPGKESWVRVRPYIYVADTECSMSMERFCAGDGKPHDCTAPEKPPKLTCTTILPDGGLSADAGGAYVRRDRARVASFVWKDGVGTCHRVPEMECKIWCHEVEGEIVPCP